MDCWSRWAVQSGRSLASAFIENIDNKLAFFQGGRVALDVGAQDLRVADLSGLRDQLSERGVALWAVLSESTADGDDGPEPGAGDAHLEAAPAARSRQRRHCRRRRRNGSKGRCGRAEKCPMKAMWS